jgi:DNA helicase II / ATP-dependent DNA helicase PcrA
LSIVTDFLPRLSMQHKEALQNLNSEQKLAVETIDGPVLVVAGAGTGKTQLLALRIVNILKNTDTLPQNILCLSYTDSGAFNLRQRLQSYLGIEGQKVAVHTFHSLGAEIINQNPEYFYFGASFRTVEEYTSKAILEEILENEPTENLLRKSHPEEGWVYLSDIYNRISDLKQAGLTPEEYIRVLDQNKRQMQGLEEILHKTFDLPRINTLKEEGFLEFVQECINQLKPKIPKPDYDLNSHLTDLDWALCLIDSLDSLMKELQSLEKFSTKPISIWRDRWIERDATGRWCWRDDLNNPKYLAVADIYQKYLDLLHARRYFDFDDMLLEVLNILKTKPEIRFKYQEKYLYFMIDEFQDTNGIQIAILDNLTRSETLDSPNILAVGDDDQSIYKFQRATLANIRNFRKKYPKLKIITLHTNYRSNQAILDFADFVIGHCQDRLADWPEVEKKLRSVEQKNL